MYILGIPSFSGRLSEFAQGIDLKQDLVLAVILGDVCRRKRGPDLPGGNACPLLSGLSIAWRSP